VLRAAAECPEPTVETRALARNQLSQDGLLLHVVAAIQRQSRILESQLATMNLVTDEGRLKAIQQQGRLSGLKLALVQIFSLAEEEFKQDD
jgi:hypothetical protein